MSYVQLQVMFNSCNISSAYKVNFVLVLKLTPVLCFGQGLHDPCEKRSINVYKTFRPYVAFVMEINYISFMKY